MRVYVNDRPVFVTEGMTVRHALLAAGCGKGLEMVRVRDAWGNEVGLDGALSEGQKLQVALPGEEAGAEHPKSERTEGTPEKGK